MPESSFDARALPVDPLPVIEFVKLQPEQLEKFLNRIIASIQGNTAMNEKLNTLKYLESLCTNIEASNILINGPLMPLLVKMLRTLKPPGLRVQLASVMGLLIRHATLIEEDLAGSGIVAVLTETLRDKQDKVYFHFPDGCQRTLFARFRIGGLEDEVFLNLIALTFLPFSVPSKGEFVLRLGS